MRPCRVPAACLLLLPLLSGCLAGATVTASPVMIDATTGAPAPTPTAPTATAPSTTAPTDAATAAASASASSAPAATPAPSPADASPKRFDPPLGVAKAEDFAALEAAGVSHDFVNFAKVTLASAPDPTCPGTMTVAGFVPTGFAAGTQGAACKPEREKALWARSGGVWVTVWHGTGVPDCAALRGATFPADLAGAQCVDGGATVGYR